MVHIYRAEPQSATSFLDPNGPGRPFRIRFASRAQIGARCCRRLRWAKFLQVQVYYDAVVFTCRRGCGCQARRAGIK